MNVNTETRPELSPAETVCAAILDRLKKPSTEFYVNEYPFLSRRIGGEELEAEYTKAHGLRVSLPEGYKYIGHWAAHNPQLLRQKRLVAVDTALIKIPKKPVTVYGELELDELKRVNAFTNELYDRWRGGQGDFNYAVDVRYYQFSSVF